MRAFLFPGNSGKRIFFFAWLCMLASFYSCKEESTPPLDCSNLKLDLLSKNNVSACGLEDGQLAVVASDGIPPYTYELNSIKNTTGIFTGLQVGAYQIKVTGGNSNCTRTVEIVIGNDASSFSATALGAGSTECAPASNGSITVAASNGIEPYSFKLDNGPFQSENVFSGLSTGNYFVEVRDAENCAVLINVKVPGIRYETIKSLIELNCATANCHNGDLGAQSNYLIFENVKENSTGIRARTSNKTMPPSGNLSQEQIDIIACWVAEGANN